MIKHLGVVAVTATTSRIDARSRRNAAAALADRAQDNSPSPRVRPPGSPPASAPGP